MTNCICSSNYTTFSLIGQERSVDGKTIPGIISEYKKAALDGIRKGLFQDCLSKAKAGATEKEVYQYQVEEITRIFKLKKLLKVLHNSHKAIFSIFNKASSHFQRGRSRTPSSNSKKRTSNNSSSDSGDSEPGEPAPHSARPGRNFPPFLFHLKKLKLKQRLYIFLFSWFLASCCCLMVRGWRI